MPTLRCNNLFWLAAALALLVAVLLAASWLFLPIGWLTLPATWPGVLILAVSPEDRYSYWKQLVLVWLCSLPCILFYAWWLRRWWERRKVAHEVS